MHYDKTNHKQHQNPRTDKVGQERKYVISNIKMYQSWNTVYVLI